MSMSKNNTNNNINENNNYSINTDRRHQQQSDIGKKREYHKRDSHHRDPHRDHRDRRDHHRDHRDRHRDHHRDHDRYNSRHTHSSHHHHTRHSTHNNNNNINNSEPNGNYSTYPTNNYHAQNDRHPFSNHNRNDRPNDRSQNYQNNKNNDNSLDDDDNFSWKKKQRSHYDPGSPPLKKRKINYGSEKEKEKEKYKLVVAEYEPPPLPHTTYGCQQGDIENALRNTNNSNYNTQYFDIEIDEEKRRKRMQRFGTTLPINPSHSHSHASHQQYHHNNNPNRDRDHKHNNNQKRRYNHSDNNRYNDRYNNNNRRFNRNNNNYQRNRHRNNNNNRNKTDLRMSPQYDSDGNQKMSFAVYQIRNNKFDEMARKQQQEKQHKKEEKKMEKLKIRQKQKRILHEEKKKNNTVKQTEKSESDTDKDIDGSFSDIRLSAISSCSSSADNDIEKFLNENDNIESNLTEKPLFLVCANDGWNMVLNDTNRRSFGGYKANPFSKKELDLWWNLMTDSNGLSGGIKWVRPKLHNGRSLPRKAAWLVSENCRCCYRYSQTKWKPIIFPAWFKEITERVLSETGLKFEYEPNACNVNWYENGVDSVGWHSDDEGLFQSKHNDCLIISLSLGQSRKFEVKLQDNKHSNDIILKEKLDIKQIILHNGDLMTMEGLFQKHYLHRVPKSIYIDKARINFTWRWIKKHYFYRDNCPEKTNEGTGSVTKL